MTPTMRRTPSASLAAGSLGLVLLLSLTGCGGEDGEEPGDAATTPAAVGSASEEPDVEDGDEVDDAEPADTYGEGSVPVTVEVDVKDLPGFEEVRFWKGTDLIPGVRTMTGGLVVDGEELAVLVGSTEAVITEDTAAGAMRYWRNNNSFTDGPTELLDPVVVDGLEMLRARGESGERRFDYFTRLSDAGDELHLLFSLPQELSEAEAEDYIGSVLAAVDFE